MSKVNKSTDFNLLVPWHDDKYAKAREILKKKKIGEML
jgi:hypothetical protein